MVTHAVLWHAHTHTIQERACYLASNPAKEETLETERMSYTLPDGSSLDIGPAR